MGIISHVFHKTTKKHIEKMIERFKTGAPDSRAGVIFYAWFTRGINLAEVLEHNRQKLEMLRNKFESFSVNIPIYYYAPGAEVPINELIKQLRKVENNTHNNSIAHALRLHQYTNLAVSLPSFGYGTLAHDLWYSLIQNYSDINEVVQDFKQLIESPDVQKTINNNDVSVAELMENPKRIIPHFLVQGHPLSVELLEMGKFRDEFKYQIMKHKT